MIRRTAALALRVLALWSWAVLFFFPVTSRTVVQWTFLRPFAALAVLTLAGMVTNLTGQYEVVTLTHLSALDVVWTAYTLVLLFLCGLVCVERPKAGEADSPEVRRASVRGTVSAIYRRLLR